MNDSLDILHYDGTEYEPRHTVAEADRKLMDLCLVLGVAVVFLIAAILVYLGVEAIRYNVAYLSPLFFVVGIGTIAYILYLTKIEDWVRDTRDWYRRRKFARDTKRESRA